MMIDLEQLKADRKAGTDGPWHLQHDDEIWSKDDLYVGMVGNTKDTRRIARLPELEAAYIDVATKLDKAVKALQEIDNIAGAWPLSEGNEDSLGLLEMCGKVSVKALALITDKPERDE